MNDVNDCRVGLKKSYVGMHDSVVASTRSVCVLECVVRPDVEGSFLPFTSSS